MPPQFYSCMQLFCKSNYDERRHLGIRKILNSQEKSAIGVEHPTYRKFLMKPIIGEIPLRDIKIFPTQPIIGEIPLRGIKTF